MELFNKTSSRWRLGTYLAGVRMHTERVPGGGWGRTEEKWGLKTRAAGRTVLRDAEDTCIWKSWSCFPLDIFSWLMIKVNRGVWSMSVSGRNASSSLNVILTSWIMFSGRLGDLKMFPFQGDRWNRTLIALAFKLRLGYLSRLSDGQWTTFFDPGNRLVLFSTKTDKSFHLISQLISVPFLKPQLLSNSAKKAKNSSKCQQHQDYSGNYSLDTKPAPSSRRHHLTDTVTFPSAKKHSNYNILSYPYPPSLYCHETNNRNLKRANIVAENQISPFTPSISVISFSTSLKRTRDDGLTRKNMPT